MALVAIARRRRLLNDNVIVALADSSWQILDLSGSEVSDFGLSQVVKTCRHLQAVDIRYLILIISFIEGFFVLKNIMQVG